MPNHSLIVVADKFSEFAIGKPAVTFSQVQSMLTLPEHLLPGPIQLLRGQGLSDTDVDQLISNISATSSPRKRWDTSKLGGLPKRASPLLSHKHKECNTLICEPNKVDDKTYIVHVNIDQNCELMSDHQTGQHVQGMVLIEATRQSFIAVTEKYFLDNNAQRTYFVINSMNTEFLGFVFPLEAYIEYKVETEDTNDRRKKFQVQMRLFQSGEIRMRNTCSFAVYPKKVISEKESSLALDAAGFILTGPREMSQPS